MKWKDSNDTVEPDAVDDDEPTIGKSFSIKKDDGMRPSGQSSLQAKKIPVILVGGGVLILVVVLIWLIFGSGSNVGVQQINFLESRIKALENQITGLEPMAATANNAAQQAKAVAELTRRVDGLETVFTKEIDSLAKRLAALTPQKTAAAPPPVKALPSPTGAKATPSQKTVNHVHVVQAGENLYRISQRYNLKMDELLRLNNLKAGASIQVGQKLRVGPPKAP